jgi:hypothetical protein
VILNATISKSSSKLLVGLPEICCLTSSNLFHFTGSILSSVPSGNVPERAFTFTVTLLYFSDFSIVSIFKFSRAVVNSKIDHVNSSTSHVRASISHVKLCFRATSSHDKEEEEVKLSPSSPTV